MRPQHTVTVAGNALVLDAEQDRQVDIRLVSARLEEQAGSETIARLLVERADGQRALFFVLVRLNQQGRVIAELIAKKPDGSEVCRSVQGYWKAPLVPASTSPTTIEP
jgi:hypothetical protein